MTALLGERKTRNDQVCEGQSRRLCDTGILDIIQIIH